MNGQIPQLPREGEQVGAGVIIDRISTGGSAVIYKTWLDALELHRAVKVMHPDADNETRQRMLTEARISSKLTHRNIVQVYNYGETAAGLPYIEMDIVNGVTLEDIIEKHGALPLPASSAITVLTLEALHYLHTAKYTLNSIQHHGVIHRDIKPMNIMIAAETGEVKLMDFGIARPTGISMHTVPGTAPGTLNYMAPETYADGVCDARSDIYQTGLLLYECLCGRAAFPQTNRVALNDAKTENAYEPIDTQCRADMLEAAAIIEKCMRSDPGKRYQSAQDCLTDVRALYSALCPRAAPEDVIRSFLTGSPLPRTAPKRDYKKPLKTAALAAAAVLAVTGITAAAVSYSPKLLRAAVRIYARLQADAPAPNVRDERAGTIASGNNAETTVPDNRAETPTIPDKRTTATASDKRVEKPTIPDKRTTATALDERAGTAASGNSAAAPAPNPGANGADSALALISRADKLLADKKYGEALDAYQKAIKTPSAAPRQEVVRKSLYGAAKCNTALFQAGQAPRPNYIAAWRGVANAYPPDSPQYAEAQSYLDEKSAAPPPVDGDGVK